MSNRKVENEKKLVTAAMIDFDEKELLNILDSINELDTNIVQKIYDAVPNPSDKFIEAVLIKMFLQ